MFTTFTTDTAVGQHESASFYGVTYSIDIQVDKPQGLSREQEDLFNEIATQAMKSFINNFAAFIDMRLMLRIDEPSTQRAKESATYTTPFDSPESAKYKMSGTATLDIRGEGMSRKHKSILQGWGAILENLQKELKSLGEQLEQSA